LEQQTKGLVSEVRVIINYRESSSSLHDLEREKIQISIKQVLSKVQTVDINKYIRI
jgi:hypothetical protein